VHFLNAMLGGELPAPIVDVVILNPYNERPPSEQAPRRQAQHRRRESARRGRLFVPDRDAAAGEAEPQTEKATQRRAAQSGRRRG
jgi:hypothetical protein